MRGIPADSDSPSATDGSCQKLFTLPESRHGRRSAEEESPLRKSRREKEDERKKKAPRRARLGVCVRSASSLPEAHEVEAWGEPTFRVRNKLFAMHSSAGTHHGRGRPGVWIASTHVSQDMVLRARPDRYFSPPYVGPSGWIGAWLDKSPLWGEITELLRDAYRLKAPKKLADTLED